MRVPASQIKPILLSLTQWLARPTVEATRLRRGELYENAASVRSQYGGGRNGLLGMLMPLEEYNTIAPGMPLKLPPDRPDIPDLEGEGAEEMK